MSACGNRMSTVRSAVQPIPAKLRVANRIIDMTMAVTTTSDHSRPESI